MNVEAKDEGGYWQGRNIEVLANEVGDWNQFIAAFAGAIKDVAGKKGVTIEAASPLDSQTSSDWKPRDRSGGATCGGCWVAARRRQEHEVLNEPHHAFPTKSLASFSNASDTLMSEPKE